MDPENFADQAYLTMNAWQIELADSRIGCLRLFSPDNPTGLDSHRLLCLFERPHHASISLPAFMITPLTAEVNATTTN